MVGGEEGHRGKKTGQSKGALTEIRCTEEQHLTLKRRTKVGISHIRTKIRSVKSFQRGQWHTRRRSERFYEGKDRGAVD